MGQHGRWAVWPGLPVPISWLLAPLLVADMCAASAYLVELKEHKAIAAAMADIAGTTGDGEKVAGTRDDDTPRPPLSNFEVSAALAACHAIDERSWVDCQPPPEDVAVWSRELELAAEKHASEAPISPGAGAVWADLFGALLAVGLAGVMRGRRFVRP